MKDNRSNIKIEPETRDRLKVVCAQSKETYSQWIERKLNEERHFLGFAPNAEYMALANERIERKLQENTQLTKQKQK